FAAVLFDHLANDREPDATAGDATGHVRAAGEAFEDACEVCLRDTDALVGDSALSDVIARRVSRADAYPHTAVLAVVLDRVRHEVRDVGHGQQVIVEADGPVVGEWDAARLDRKSTRLNSSHEWISYAVFCWKRKIKAV